MRRWTTITKVGHFIFPTAGVSDVRCQIWGFGSDTGWGLGMSDDRCQIRGFRLTRWRAEAGESERKLATPSGS